MKGPENGLSITANPTPGLTHISLQNPPAKGISYTLTNLAGQSLTGYAGSFRNELDVDLSGLPAGMYLLRLESEEFEEGECLRIVKE